MVLVIFLVYTSIAGGTPLVQPSELKHQPMDAFPRLVDQLVYLFAVAESADRRPTAQTHERFADTVAAIGDVLTRIDDVVRRLDTHNARIRDTAVPPLRWMPQPTPPAEEDDERRRTCTTAEVPDYMSPQQPPERS